MHHYNEEGLHATFGHMTRLGILGDRKKRGWSAHGGSLAPARVVNSQPAAIDRVSLKAEESRLLATAFSPT
jgi:hypothetical protein